MLALEHGEVAGDNGTVSRLPLGERLRSRIETEGPLRFDEFQRAALYDPVGGYYERPGRVGRSGDFVTGASWHPAFARCLARIARRLAGEIPAPFAVVDVGAGEGELLGFLAEERLEEIGAELYGVEASAVRRAAAAGRVPAATLVDSVSALPPGLSGLVVAYELLDALPVRAFRVTDNGALVERRVGLDAAGRFSWVEALPSDDSALLEGLVRRGAVLEPGQILEVRPGAAELVRAIGARLSRGLILFFDYGAQTRALYGPSRSNGTLEAFVAHRVTRDVLEDPGGRDITAWVDFGEVDEALRAEGFVVQGLVSQARLLLSAGIAAELVAPTGAALPAERAVERNAVAKLVMPGGMGESIRVLVADRDTGLGKSLISSALV
jgi:SAM-dependent MidA family methyltransferase